MKTIETLLAKLFKSNIRLLLFFTIVWFSTFFFTGTLFTGMHFEDDQEIIEMNDDINSQHKGVIHALTYRQTRDLGARFRPLFWPPRVLETKLFGLNFPLWSSMQCILCILSCFFLFKFCRLLKYSNIESLLFPLFSIVGVQTSVFWRLGTVEPLGLFLLSITLCYMVKASIEKENMLRNNILFSGFLILSSISKENFILITPAILFLKVWIQSKQNKISFADALRKNSKLTIVFAVLCLAEILLVQKVVGTNKTGYVGLDVNFFDPIKIWNLIYVYCIKNFLFLIPLTAFLFLVNKKVALTKVISTNGGAVLFALLIAIPQFILHFKCGINERYLIPGIIGITFLNMYVIHKIYNSNVFSSLQKNVVGFVIAFILIFNGLKLSVRGYIYGEEGRETKKFLTSIVRNTNPNSYIVIAGNPLLGWACPLSCYLQSTAVNRKNTFLESMESINNYDEIEKTYWVKDVARYFKNKTFDKIDSTTKITTVVVYEDNETKFIAENKWFDKSKYTRVEFGRSVFMGNKSYGKMIYYFR